MEEKKKGRIGAKKAAVIAAAAVLAAAGGVSGYALYESARGAQAENDSEVVCETVDQDAIVFAFPKTDPRNGADLMLTFKFDKGAITSLSSNRILHVQNDGTLTSYEDTFGDLSEVEASFFPDLPGYFGTDDFPDTNVYFDFGKFWAYEFPDLGGYVTDFRPSLGDDFLSTAVYFSLYYTTEAWVSRGAEITRGGIIGVGLSSENGGYATLTYADIYGCTLESVYSYMEAEGVL